MWRKNSITKKKQRQFFIHTILGLAIILGVIVRYQFISHTKFPLNDGGYFFQMTEELVENNFRLPVYTAYNDGDIPYAYPPMAFYLIGGLHKFLNIPLISLFRYLPATVSVLTLPAFYLLSKKFLEDRFLRVAALYLFAMLPRSFEWFVMGGGVTRSLGFLFSLLAIKYIYELFSDAHQKKSPTILAAVFSGLTVLSHPVTALFLIFSTILIYLFRENRIGNLRKGFLLSVWVLAITSPWWGTVVYRHGWAPFLGAGGTGHVNWFEIKNLLTLNFEFENPFFLSVYGVFAILGVFFVRGKSVKQLSIALFIGYIVMPRGGVDLLSAYMALLAAQGVHAVLGGLPPGLSTRSSGLPDVIAEYSRAKVFLVFVFIYVFFAAYTYKYVQGKSSLHLTQSEDLAMQWIQRHTDNDAAFVVYPPRGERRFWWNDFRAEWFPALTHRVNFTTVQGYEWRGDEFSRRVSRYVDLYFCDPPGVDCVESWAEDYGLSVEYVYIGERGTKSALVRAFHREKNYVAVYINKETILFHNISEK